MIVGFTVTREGMDKGQVHQLLEHLAILYSQPPVGLFARHEFHHGDAIGADSQAHDLVRKHFPNVHIEIHPCDLMSQRAYKQGDRTHEPLPPLKRNRNIVRACSLLLVAPVTNIEETGSGTWSTKRYAEKTGVEYKLLWRNKK